ncbi:1-deoxy-D-xylulose-5-phosphate reductoisomerase [Kordiimonas sp. SCSIO 12603]|uniref:1-deoxy-D-xylulose-5-phosphate reductoisomerase n=1 Tax=Kordiimonas sp. SCSIO 12603 TaxID=2829596 RepID=UPI0021034CC9|nr:1-deoxy-D-xylulose-5-phosphate reductoisomerase [Kordiimonas sp. SCSIO 12603]UTW57479.1 1-deoxy-D-xylulose-5-phosphate reductoisomerase [Kordiimonas sp. SCSIO 12603]
MTKTISLLGATGSVGQSTLELIRKHPGKFEVRALTAFSRVAELAALALEFNANLAVIGDETKLTELKERLQGSGIEVAAGEQGLLEAAAYPSDMVLAAIVGAAGLRPTLTAVRRGATIALANKECLVCAGDLMMKELEAHNSTLLPVDSEHNAIFQVFDADHAQTVSRLILTASGGPFLNRELTELKNITPALAVAHPNWDMGAKISVDSATMMNKGLEVIEAYHLFPVDKEQIDVLVHPQSVIHSMVEYIDGSTLAQLGSPDMVVPIASCLAWPDRISTPAKKLNLAEIGQLTFQEPDYDKFRCLALAKEALYIGGAATTVLNAANEVAVDAFLKENIPFLAVPELVSRTLEKSDMKAPHSLTNVFEIDQEARRLASSFLDVYAK